MDMCGDYKKLFRDKYREIVLLEFSHELALVKQMIETCEEAIRTREPADSWCYEGICYMFARSIIDYAKMAYDNMCLGHFYATHMIFRTMIENTICLDIIQRDTEHELWKYYMVQSYRNALKSTGGSIREKDAEFIEEMYLDYGINQEFYTKSRKNNSQRPFAYIDKDYGWTYKINNNFSFAGLCNLVNEREYKDFKIMSMYSHGTAIHLKMDSFASMDYVFTMLSFFYYSLNRLTTLYCADAVSAEFERANVRLEHIIMKYIKECEMN